MEDNKWIIFIHGVSGNGRHHGKGIEQAIQKLRGNKETCESSSSSSSSSSNWNIYFCTSNTSIYSSTYSLYLTTKGVVQFSQGVLEEIEQLHSKKSITHLSIVGASFGGIAARYVIQELNNRSHWKDVEFSVLMTLASPFLGVRGLYQSKYFMNEWMISWTQSGKEMLWMDQPHCYLHLLGTNDFYLGALKRFKKRCIYAPLWNDGIVTYDSASLASKPFVDIKQSNYQIHQEPIIVHERSLECNTTIPDFVKNDLDETYRKRVIEVIGSLNSMDWELIDVNTDHRTLASLYAMPNSTELPPQFKDQLLLSNVVSSHIANILLSY